MAHHHRYRHRRTPTPQERKLTALIRSLVILAQRKREPRVLRVNGTYYANDLALAELRRQCPPSPAMPPGILGMGHPFGLRVERMPEWMEAALPAEGARP